MKQITFLVAVLLIGCQSLLAQGNKKDYFKIPAPVKFDGKQFFLSDAYHPESYYYKQEYIPKGENPDHFFSMVTVDIITAEVPVKDMVTRKVAELEEMKKTNPVVNYEMMEQTEKGEYMLDFILSQNEGGKVAIVEWNLYRYKVFVGKDGKKGVLLFAYTLRAYEGKTTEFIKGLKAKRPGYTKSMIEYKIPDIKIAD